MKLTFRVLGYEIARIDLDIEHEERAGDVTVLDRGIKKMSGFWVSRMNR